MDRPLPLHELVAILSRYSIDCDTSRGKGSHCMFVRVNREGRTSYPVPKRGKEVLQVYVRGCRKAFKLTAEDGVSDREFYGS